MSRSVTLNGTSYSIPQTGDSGWSLTGGVDDYLVALATGALTKSGGAFTLTANVDFGATYGLLAPYFTSKTTNPAAAGVVRLAKTDTVSFRNNANSADLALTINGSDQLTFNGTIIENIALGAANTALTMNSGGTAYAWTTITNAQIDAAAAIAYSKLNLSGSIATGDLASGLLVPANKGGTGVANNAASTLTISGAYATTLTLTGVTGVTLPTTGTLATLLGTETFKNKAIEASSTTFIGTGDATKYVKFDLSGAATSTTMTLIASTSGARALTLPDTTDTLVGRATTDTLQNKTFGAAADYTKALTFALSGATTGQTMTLASSHTTARTLTLPDATDTLVGRATTDTLKNKTIGDATDGTKALTWSLSGATTAKTLTLASSHTNNRTVTYPDATDTLVGKATTDTLTNKTIGDALSLTEISTPASPSAGTLKLYSKTDDGLYTVNSAGTETKVGSGTGEKNYLSTGSSTAASWLSVGATVATDTTAADIPRANTTKTGISLTGSAGQTFTVTVATPAVFTASAHGLQTGYPIYLTTTGALPTGLTASTVYFVTVVDANTYKVSTTMANVIAGTFVATSGTQSGTHTHHVSVAYYRFTLDAADYNKKLKLQYDQNLISGAGTDWEVDIWSNTNSSYTGTWTRLALSTDSSTQTQVPNLEGTFGAAFDSPGSAAQYLELRLCRTSTSTPTLVLSDVIVGPGVVTQGAAVSQWQSYTPTWAGAGGNPAIGNGTLYAFYRRVGDTAEIRIGVTTGTTTTYGSANWNFTLPPGLTGNTSVLANVPGNNYYPLEGSAEAFVTSGQTMYPGQVAYGSSGNVLYMQSANQSNWSATVPAAWTAATASQGLIIHAFLPINEWAGSGTVNVVQNDVEYQSNSSVTNSSDTTSFVAGSAGSVVPTITAATGSASINKRVQFNTPIQATDQLVLQFQDSGTGSWLDIQNNDSYFSPVFQSTTAYGVGMIPVSATQVDVAFYPGGRISTGTTLGTAGASFPRNSTDRWRVKKFSGGAAVGFSQIDAAGTQLGLVKAGAQIGYTGGNAIAAGNVGQVLVSTVTSQTFLTGPAVVTSTTLTPGVWMITANVSIAGNQVNNYVEIGVSTTSGSFSGLTESLNLARGAVGPTNNAGGAVITGYVVNISSSTTYYLNVALSTNSTTGCNASLSAVRIA